MGDWILEAEKKAADSVREVLALPLPEDSYMIGVEGYFDPWSLFPSIYGSYSSDFDECAIAVLRELSDPKYDGNDRRDLGALMFRELLCVSDLCAYGTSPRVCFSTQPFKEVLPELISKWVSYYEIQWGHPLDENNEMEKEQ